MDANHMNHRYHFLNEDHVISEEEHQYVLRSLREGRAQIILRNGKLIMNLVLAFSAVETERLTLEQEEKLHATLRLESARSEAKEMAGGDGIFFLIKTHFPFYEKMGWEHNEECICKIGSAQFKSLLVKQKENLEWAKEESNFGQSFS